MDHQGFLCRALRLKYSRELWTRGYQVALGCLIASRSTDAKCLCVRPCLVVAGEAFPAASQTACSRLARGRTLRWLQQLGRSVCRGEIKMGKHGRSHQPKEISTRARHTNNHCSFMAPWKAARAVVSRSFCHICNTR